MTEEEKEDVIQALIKSPGTKELYDKHGTEGTDYETWVRESAVHLLITWEEGENHD